MAIRCPFCEQDPAEYQFHSDLAYGIWDNFPVSEGHFLVVSKRHVADWFELTDDEKREIQDGLNIGRTLVQSRHEPQGFNIGINIGTAAGQTIPHLHVHLIPRYEDDVPDPSGGVRNVIPDKGNYLAHESRPHYLIHGIVKTNRLVQGLDNPLVKQLKSQIDQADSVDIAVAFVLRSGVELIYDNLRDLVARGGRLRLLTGDYLDFTDPEQLQRLDDLRFNASEELGLRQGSVVGKVDIRIFECKGTNFHPKSYIFRKADGEGTAFIGSSNLTKPALTDAVEWNYRVIHSDADEAFREVTVAFDQLFKHPNVKEITPEWIDRYRQRRAKPTTDKITDLVPEPDEAPPTPHAIQQEALKTLEDTRLSGNEAGLVVLATGLGKTWLAAFDSSRKEFSSVLFVAHREEILRQAMNTFRRIRPHSRIGFYTGKEKDSKADVLFASVQTLGRSGNLNHFARDRFDYIVIDEFHHAAARTYRNLIDYFAPKFLLGLTATPERMDGGDLLGLCQENLVYRKDLVAGIDAGLLCPFQYYGVPDAVNYENIPWRSSKFDETELTNAVATNQRAQNALDQLESKGGKRALGFCCSQRHADFMADFFVKQGKKAVAVHSGNHSAPRASSLEALAEGRLDIIFAVDMFNEGLDLPNIDTVLMLRPTESSIVWMQQFGRGLRKSENKPELKVIDYIGNHRSFLVKIRSMIHPLVDRCTSDAEISAAMRLLEKGELELPEGCGITYELEAIDIIRSLLRTRADDDAIIAFYEDFKERHGFRPSALELYHSGYNPRSVRKSHQSWIGFVRSMGDLDDVSALETSDHEEFLDTLDGTPMTKSFKMVTLQAMLNLNKFPGRVTINELTEEFRRIINRSQKLRQDVGPSIKDLKSLQVLIEKNPIAAWSLGKGTNKKSFFNYRNEVFEFLPQFETDDQASNLMYQDLVRELVDWRLAEYIDRSDDSVADIEGWTCRVMQSGGRPILKLPDRKKVANIPVDWAAIEADGKRYWAKFASKFVNVIRDEPESKENLIGELMRGWFGNDAGQPGTRFDVRFEQRENHWLMVPAKIGVLQRPERWRHYKREGIPPLFGEVFNTGNWNQGFIALPGNLILLVTLDKGGLPKEHRYEDVFLSPEQFQWVSQNRTTQNSRHGQLISKHKELEHKVQLFVRKKKVVAGKASPFVYCGEVEFESWEGEKPITVIWNLPELVPDKIWNEVKKQ